MQKNHTQLNRIKKKYTQCFLELIISKAALHLLIHTIS